LRIDRPKGSLSDVYLSIVIPAFDEEARIGATLNHVRSYLAAQDYESEIVVVDDGSTDATASIVKQATGGRPKIRLVSTAHRGKGHAVKTGMLEALGEFRFLCDADLAMPIDQVSRFIPPALEGVDVAVGSREAPGARRFEEPVYRHVMGRVYNSFVRIMAVSGISDTQAGFKCFRSDVARRLFEQQRLDGFGFDVEILFLARWGGLRIAEVPIDWYHQTESKLRPVRDTIAMLRETFQVRWNRLRGRYHRVGAEENLG
jgi:glycosyltransferase involved in cell wall biosynthesis